MATKEQVYIAKLESLGIYSPAFDDAIHQLCLLEREHSRVMKAWKASKPEGEKHPSFAHELYPVILRLRNDIRASRDELGLTPKSLRKLTGELGKKNARAKPESNVLTMIKNRHAG